MLKSFLIGIMIATLAIPNVAVAHDRNPHHAPPRHHDHHRHDRRSNNDEKILWAIGGAVIAGAIIHQRNKQERVVCEDHIIYHNGRPYLREICFVEKVR